MTCQEFKCKVQQAIAGIKHFSLTGEVHIDEFYVG